MRAQRSLQIRIEHAGLADREPVRGIDREDAVHALERNHDAARDRNARAGRIGAAAARDERNKLRAAGTHECDDLLVRRRKHDSVRQRFAPRVVVTVDEPFRFVSDETGCAERRAQEFDQVRWQIHDAACLP